VRQEGWQWVQILPDADFDTLRSFGEVKGKRQPLPAKQAKALAKTEREADRLREAEELTDEEAERLDVLDAEITVLSEHEYVWSDRQKARAGAVISLDHDGKLAVLRGLIRPEDMKAKTPDSEEAAASDAAEQSAPPCFSSALADDLTAHRTAALRAVLAERTEVALAAAAYALALPVFYADHDDSGLAVRAAVPYLRAEGIGDSPAVKVTAEQHAAWVTRLPEAQISLWDWLRAQDAATVAALLACCTACTVKPERGLHTDKLAAAVALDMTQWWQPTVTGYLGRVPKTLILEAVTEGKSAAAADNLIALKKSEMADRAAQLLTGTGWLPAMLRAATASSGAVARSGGTRCARPLSPGRVCHAHAHRPANASAHSVLTRSALTVEPSICRPAPPAPDSRGAYTSRMALLARGASSPPCPRQGTRFGSAGSIRHRHRA
jgi:ParB family chromosome partitioning protein